MGRGNKKQSVFTRELSDCFSSNVDSVASKKINDEPRSNFKLKPGKSLFHSCTVREFDDYARERKILKSGRVDAKRYVYMSYAKVTFPIYTYTLEDKNDFLIGKKLVKPDETFFFRKKIQKSNRDLKEKFSRKIFKEPFPLTIRMPFGVVSNITEVVVLPFDSGVIRSISELKKRLYWSNLLRNYSLKDYRLNNEEEEVVGAVEVLFKDIQNYILGVENTDKHCLLKSVRTSDVFDQILTLYRSVSVPDLDPNVLKTIECIASKNISLKYLRKVQSIYCCAFGLRQTLATANFNWFTLVNKHNDSNYRFKLLLTNNYISCIKDHGTLTLAHNSTINKLLIHE